MGLQLFHGSTCLGRIEEPFEHQGTWFGTFRTSLDAGDPVQRRISEYLAFCQAWDERVAADEEADASEFDAFDDVLRSERWYTRDEHGVVTPITSAPFFRGSVSPMTEGAILLDGELSWRID